MSIEFLELHGHAPGLVGDETADWSVLDDPKAREVAQRAARRLAIEYADTRTIEYEDALQEALLILATNARMVRECLATAGLGYGVLHTRVYQRLVKLVRTDARHRSSQTSFEANMAALGPEAV